MLALIRQCLRLLPLPLAAKVYYHLLRNRAMLFRDAFQAAPLRLCPELLMNLNPSDTAHGYLAFTGVYEEELTSHFARLSKPGGLLVDVGANFGYYSLLWCGLNPKNRSIAFEASPIVIPRLRENIEINHVGDKIDLREVAASNQSGAVSFDIGPLEQTGWGGISNNDAAEHVLRVISVRLDDVIDAAEIALFKIDCEGADYLVLQGAERLLREKRIRHIFFEENLERMKQLDIEPGSSARYVQSLGYECAALDASSTPSEYHAWV